MHFRMNFQRMPDLTTMNYHVYLENMINPEWFCEMPFYGNKRIKKRCGHGSRWTAATRCLKACAAEIAPALTLLNRCLVEIVFPVIWKEARITSIPTVPRTDCVHEFQPISFLPVLAEIWMKEDLSPCILKNINENQFAYDKGRSTEDAVSPWAPAGEDSSHGCSLPNTVLVFGKI